MSITLDEDVAARFLAIVTTVEEISKTQTAMAVNIAEVKMRVGDLFDALKPYNGDKSMVTRLSLLEQGVATAAKAATEKTRRRDQVSVGVIVAILALLAKSAWELVTVVR